MKKLTKVEVLDSTQCVGRVRLTSDIRVSKKNPSNPRYAQDCEFKHPTKGVLKATIWASAEQKPKTTGEKGDVLEDMYIHVNEWNGRRELRAIARAALPQRNEVSTDFSL